LDTDEWFADLLGVGFGMEEGGGDQRRLMGLFHSLCISLLTQLFASVRACRNPMKAFSFYYMSVFLRVCLGFLPFMRCHMKSEFTIDILASPIFILPFTLERLFGYNLFALGKHNFYFSLYLCLY
jgi:hypothetical protein